MAATAAQHLIEGGAGILHEVEAVGDPRGVEGTLSRPLGVGFGPIAGDDRYAGMVAEPLRQRLGFPAGQQVDRAVRLDIDEDRRVAVPAT